CYAAWKNRLPLLWQPMLFGAVWLLADLARARWFTGFPWGATGYAHADGLLALLTACNMTTSPPAFADRPALSVALLQGNIPQDQKFEGGTGIPLALD